MINSNFSNHLEENIDIFIEKALDNKIFSGAAVGICYGTSKKRQKTIKIYVQQPKSSLTPPWP